MTFSAFFKCFKEFNNYTASHVDSCVPSDRLKSAVARRTGRSADDICFEERRRSARVAEEENLSLEESGLVLERGSRRARKEEPKLSDVCTLWTFFSLPHIPYSTFTLCLL